MKASGYYISVASKYERFARDLEGSGAVTLRSVGYRLKQASALMRLGQYRDARVIYLTLWNLYLNKEMPHDGRYLEAVLGNARCLEMLGNHSGAAFNYRRLYNLSLTSDYFDQAKMLDIIKSLAWNYELSGDVRSAANFYNVALESAIGNSDTQEARILALRVAVCASRSDNPGEIEVKA